jgi:hypothetical protein
VIAAIANESGADEVWSIPATAIISWRGPRPSAANNCGVIDAENPSGPIAARD